MNSPRAPKIKNRFLPILAVLTAVLTGLPLLVPVKAQALQISQEEFADSFIDGDLELILMGAALKRFGVMKAVAVAFYLEKGIEETDIMTEVPKRVEIAYLQRISRKELLEEATEGIRDNVSADEFTALADEMKQFAGWLRDADPGDRYTLTYRPGEGTEVELNGVPQGVIASDVFARGYFSIYVGAKPSDPRAKRKLLGRLYFNQ